ncbi:phosphatidylethanolamine-binding protein 4-like [Lithobates pipiens]
MAKKYFASLFFLSLTSSSFVLTRPISCDFDRLFGVDASFCSGNLHVIYPNMGDASCVYIPNCYEYSQSLINVWGAPRIKFPDAKPENLYTLIMVDPDAPSRAKPIHRFWRHWLVSDILGKDLQKGGVTGTVQSKYYRPKPLSHTGLHRYQFLIYKQHPQVSPSLLPRERTLASWDVAAFVNRSRLGDPVATTQFMAMNPRS